jgi:hypothetical protein
VTETNETFIATRSEHIYLYTQATGHLLRESHSAGKLPVRGNTELPTSHPVDRETLVIARTDCWLAAMPKVSEAVQYSEVLVIPPPVINPTRRFVSVTTKCDGSIGLSVDGQYIGRAQVPGNPVSVFGSDGKFNFALLLNGQKVSKRAVLFTNTDGSRLAVPSRPLHPPSTVDVMESNLTELPGQKGKVVFQNYTDGVHEVVKRPFFAFRPLRPMSDPGRPASEMEDPVGRMPTPTGIYWPFHCVGIVVFVLYCVLQLFSVSKPRRITISRRDPRVGTCEGRPCSVVVTRATSMNDLSRLSQLQISGILRPIAYEQTREGFVIAYPLDALCKFEVSPANFREFAERILKTLAELHAMSYVIEGVDGDCFFGCGDRPLIGRLETRLREGCSATQLCKMMNEFGAFLLKERPREPGPLDPFLEDLLSELCDPDPEEAPTPSEAAVHPYFWSATMLIHAIQRMSDVLLGDTAMMRRFDEQTAVVVGQNWKRVVDEQIVADAQQKIMYDGTKMSQLIRLIRNKAQHPAVDNLGRRLPCLGYSDDEYFAYWQKLFPNLFLFAHYFLETEQVRKPEREFDYPWQGPLSKSLPPRRD